MSAKKRERTTLITIFRVTCMICFKCDEKRNY